MAAPTEVHECCDTNPMEQIKLGVFEKSEQTANISSQLLYPETYGDSYREDKLTVLGKGCPAVKGQQKTVEMPQSSVLSRIKSFLPQLASANKDMAQELAANPESADRFNIEHIEDSEEVQVEMNFSLIPPELLGEGEPSTDDSSSESDSEPEGETQGQVSELLSETNREQTLKLRAVSSRLVKPSIEILDDVQLKNGTEEPMINR
ncbi:hypothetical protein BsWGS_13690 [Bradybaena similaris]